MSRRGDKDRDEGLLSRWSRLKRAHPEDPAQTLPEGSAPLAIEPATAEAEDEEALLARLNLPAPESLAPGDDFSRFMARDVPAFLRRRALRVLWQSKPDFAMIDGLVEYGEDYRSTGTGVVQTAYQVGRGFLRDKPEGDPAAATEGDGALSAATAEPVPATTAVRPPAARDTASGDLDPDEDEVEDTDDALALRTPAADPDPAAGPALPAPRRMVFVDDR